VNAIGREHIERVAMLAIASLAVLLAGSMLLAPSWSPSSATTQFPMVSDWMRIVRLHRLDPIADLLPTLVAIDALLAAGLAFALSLYSAPSAPARSLRRALACGCLAALYLFHVRVAWTVPLPARVVFDVASYAVGARAALDLCVFFSCFPREPNASQIHAYFRDKSRFRSQLGLGATRARAHAWLQPRLSRWFPSLGLAVGTEAHVARSARFAERFFAFTRDRRVHALLVIIAATAGLLLAMHPGGKVSGGFLIGIVPIIGVFVPMLGFSALQMNYRYGSDRDRRQIGWIYLGAAAGFTIASAMYWILGLALVPALAGDGHSLFGLELPALWVASTLLFVPLVVATFLLGLTMAVFHRGALDPRLAIRRSAVISLCGVLLTALFVIVEGAVSSQAVVRFGMPDQTGAVVAGTFAALAFAPMRNRVERAVSRWVDRAMPLNALSDGERKVVTVSFVDLSGYTALSERDESTALLHAALLRKCTQAAVSGHGGALVKSLGDGMMLRFDTPAAALAALEHLARSYQQGAAALDIAPLPVHAGVHHGEVVLARDGYLFGADVNLAARLCSAAPGGQVLVSAAARDQIPEWPLIEAASPMLKNIKARVDVFATSLGA
jgi:class 3 adenylate cyclase